MEKKTEDELTGTKVSKVKKWRNIRENPELDEKLAEYLEKAVSKEALKNLAEYISRTYRNKK